MRFIDKPWGKEEVLEVNDRYMVKRLTMLAGHRCSLQYHNVKRETIYVIKGLLRICSGPSAEQLLTSTFGPDDSITVEPGIVHRMEAVEDTVYLESSTPDMDDVVRLLDDYERKTSS